jgi:hypothetical protein
MKGFVYGYSDEGLQMRRDFETLFVDGLRIEEVRLNGSGLGEKKGSASANFKCSASVVGSRSQEAMRLLVWWLTTIGIAPAGNFGATERRAG